MNQLQNSVTLIGNIGTAPESNTTQNDVNITTFSLATNESYTNKKGDKITTTQWHRCVVFGKKGAIIQQYVKKGSKLAIQGQIRYNRYKSKDGIDRLAVDILVNDFMFLDHKDNSKAA